MGYLLLQVYNVVDTIRHITAAAVCRVEVFYVARSSGTKGVSIM